MVRMMLSFFLAASAVTSFTPPTPSFSKGGPLARASFIPSATTIFAVADNDGMDDAERRFLYGARGEGSDQDTTRVSSSGRKSEKKGDKRGMSAFDAARSAWAGITSSVAKKEEATPAERHREAVAASQADARARRGEEDPTPAERQKAAVAASQVEARLRRGEGTPAEKHAAAVDASRARARQDRETRQNAAKRTWDDITTGLADSFIATAQAFAGPNEDVLQINVDDLPPSKDVDAAQLNKLLVHADRIMGEDEEALELLGGSPISSLPDCKVLSTSPSYIMGVDGSRPTDGIRAFLEVRGPKRTGMATVVGDRRGVLLMKLTVGGQVVELKNTDGLDESAAHGVRKGGLKP